LKPDFYLWSFKELGVFLENTSGQKAESWHKSDCEKAGESWWQDDWSGCEPGHAPDRGGHLLGLPGQVCKRF